MKLDVELKTCWRTLGSDDSEGDGKGDSVVDDDDVEDDDDKDDDEDEDDEGAGCDRCASEMMRKSVTTNIFGIILSIRIQFNTFIFNENNNKVTFFK